MAISDRVPLPTSCRFLDGMEWYAEEAWITRDSNPDSPEERTVCIFSEMTGVRSCHCIFPGRYADTLHGKAFLPLHTHPAFPPLLERIEALVILKNKNE